MSDDALRFAREWTFCMDGTSESCRTIDTPCGPCSIARALLAAHEEIERLQHFSTPESKRLAMQAWFVARGARGGQFLDNPARGIACREDFERWWRDPHGYYKTCAGNAGTET